MSRLCWLHISDLHFYGSKKPAGLRFEQKLVTRQLLRDVAAMRERLGKAPDVVLLTGDIAFQAAAQEYKEAADWLALLRVELKAPKGIHVPILAVPGNHDVDRDAINETLTRQAVHEKLRAQPDRLDAFLEKDADRAALMGKQARFFLSMVNPWASSAESIPVPICPKHLDQVVVRPGVRPLLLNSALLSSDDKDSAQNLVLGGQQLHALDEQQQGDLLLVLSHHPPSWLRDGKKLLALLGKRPHLLFTGHEHEQGGEVSSRLIGGSITHFTAGAGFGDSEGDHAYSWGELSSEGLTYYPRIWHRGTLSFVDDPAQSEFVDRTHHGSCHKIPVNRLPKQLREWLGRTPEAAPPQPPLPEVAASQTIPTPKPSITPIAGDVAVAPKLSLPQKTAFCGFKSLVTNPPLTWPLSRWLAWTVMPETGFWGFRSVSLCCPSIDPGALSRTWKMSEAKQKGIEV